MRLLKKIKVTGLTLFNIKTDSVSTLINTILLTKE